MLRWMSQVLGTSATWRLVRFGDAIGGITEVVRRVEWVEIDHRGHPSDRKPTLQRDLILANAVCCHRDPGGAVDAFQSIKEARGHHAYRWRGSGVAAGGTRAAAGDAGRGVCLQRVAQR